MESGAPYKISPRGLKKIIRKMWDQQQRNLSRSEGSGWQSPWETIPQQAMDPWTRSQLVHGPPPPHPTLSVWRHQTNIYVTLRSSRRTGWNQMIPQLRCLASILTEIQEVHQLCQTWRWKYHHTGLSLCWRSDHIWKFSELNTAKSTSWLTGPVLGKVLRPVLRPVLCTVLKPVLGQVLRPFWAHF